MRIFTSAGDDSGKKRQTSTPTPATAEESPNLRTSETRTSLPELPDKRKSDERPSKEVPEERTAAQIRPTSQGARPKQRYLIATESPHESTVRQEDDSGKKRQTSTPTPATATESPDPRTSEPYTSLPKLPDKKKSNQRPSKEVPEEINVARIRPTSQGARPKQRDSIATESPHETTVCQGESDHSVRSVPLQSGVFRDPFSGVYPSFNSNTAGGFQDLAAAAESKKTLQKGESDHSVRSVPLQSGAFRDPFSGIYPPFNSNTAGGFQDLAAAAESKRTLQKDLSILGWDASPEAMSAVVNLINRHRDVLSLSTDTDCLNGLEANDVMSYFEHNLLKYCVLVVDVDKIKAVLEQERGVNLRLLQTADRNVAKGIIIAVCCSWFPSEQEKSLVRSVINKAFHDSKKVYITWFENGNLVGNPDDLINFFTLCPFLQQPTAAANCPPRVMTGKQSLPYPWDYKIYLPSGKTVFVLTRIRKGIISDLINRPEDVQYWKPGFVVPREIKGDLYKRYARTSNLELSILMTKDGSIHCQVDKKTGKEWENCITLGLDEIVVLKTKLRHGMISFEAKDLVVYKEYLKVPQDEITKLEQEYKDTPTADLFITSDPKGNSRCVVKMDTRSHMFTFIKTLLINY